MLTRQKVLSKPCWREVAAHPVLQSMPLEDLVALDSLVAFMQAHHCPTLDTGDARAWARLNGQPEGIERALHAVEALEGPDASELVALRAAQATFAEKKKFKGIPKGATRSYQRVKSVPEKDLPESWRVRLEEIDARRFDGSIALADSLFDRMKRKLCEYIRFVRDEGLAKEITLEGLQPFFQYETTRISNRGGPPRPSTVVNTFNDLRKYMQLSGDYSSELVLEMTRLLEKLRDNAEGVTARKFAALARIDPKSILPKAQSILDNAGHLLNAAKRHIQRNRALATALPPMTPLRREWHGLAFGRDIVWLEDRYRFRDYKLRKTRHRRGRETYPGSVHPSVQHFVDAVLLQDEDPKYLAAFRERAEEEEWPLFAHPDGEPVSVNYVSQVWASILGTGAHIARSILYDILFAISEDAARGGMILNDHQSRQAADRYIGAQARMAAYEAAARERDEIFEMYENDPTAGGFGSSLDH